MRINQVNYYQLIKITWEKYKPVLPFGPFFPDPDFFQEIGPEMVRICIEKSGFDQKWMNLR